MKHRVYGKHFGRDKDQRDRLFKSLVQSLFLRGSIETSQKKAGAIKGLVDKIINLAKVKSRQHLLKSYLANKDLQERLIKEIVPKISNRTSGYTSIIKLGTRFGDNTMMVRMSLIGAENLKPLEKGSSVKGKLAPPSEVGSSEEKKKEKVPVKKIAIKKKEPIRKTKSTKKPTGKRVSK